MKVRATCFKELSFKPTGAEYLIFQTGFQWKIQTSNYFTCGLKSNTLWGVFSIIVMNGKVWDLIIAVLLLSNMLERAWSCNSKMLCEWIVRLRKKRVNRFYWTWSFLTVSQSFTADNMEILTEPAVVWMNVSSQKWLIAFLFIRIKKKNQNIMLEKCQRHVLVYS